MSKSLELPYSRLQTLALSVARPIRQRALVVPRAEVAEIISGPVNVSLIDLEQANGNTSLLEQLIIICLAKHRNARRIFELGTFDGKTSANLAANLREDAHIFTIDLPAEQLSGLGLPLGRHDIPFVLKEEIGRKVRGSTRITQLYGDTARFDFSSWYGACDFVFVDACHEYEYVLNDSKTALQLLAPSGVALWHDYGAWLGVTTALNDLYRGDERFRRLRHIDSTTLCLLA